MDPITLIVTALTAGAAAALKPTAEKAVKDAYEGLRTIILDRYRRSADRLKTIEADPSAADERERLREELASMKVAEDYEAMVQAQKVLEAVQPHAEAVASEAHIDLRDIEVGANAVIERVSGDVVKITIRKAKIGENLTISDLGNRNRPAAG
jgi:hypothetical protein